MLPSEPFYDAEVYYASLTLFDFVSLLWEFIKALD
jgi:hypothetical protein